MQKLAKKLIEVMKDCSVVAKSGVNSSQNYKYTTTADVMEKVNAALTKHGIASIVNPEIVDFREYTTSKGNAASLATVKVTISLVDAESGESCTISGLGSGQDFGDKAVMKAQSAAIKYAYLLSFARDYRCEDCGKKIDSKSASYSKKKFGRPLCYSCQQLQ